MVGKDIFIPNPFLTFIWFTEVCGGGGLGEGECDAGGSDILSGGGGTGVNPSVGGAGTRPRGGGGT